MRSLFQLILKETLRFLGFSEVMVRSHCAMHCQMIFILISGGRITNFSSGLRHDSLKDEDYLVQLVRV